MKKYIFSALAVLSATTLLTSCNDALDTEPRVTEMTAATFPGKPGDVHALNAATYSIMNTLGGGDQSNILNNPYYWWCLMSDDNYGSGGLQDNVAKSLHHFTTANADQYEYDFILLYGGVSRANNQIETIDNVEWSDDQMAERKQLLGEAYFMRGFYTMLLTQMYGDVPLITSTLITDEMQEQVSAEEVIYPQIIADFVSGLNLMNVNSGYGLQGDGHANKYVAEAFLARAYMFWAGFYKKVGELASGDATMNLVDRNGDAIDQDGCDKTSISKGDVVNYLKDIESSGRYTLLKDFRSLWQYSNSKNWGDNYDNDDHTGNRPGSYEYPFIADMDLADCFDMPGNGNGNPEELFQIQFMNASNWNIGGTYNSQRMYSNYLSCFWALRNGASQNNGKRAFTYPFNMGWGQGTPSCNIWDDWTLAEKANGKTDKRKLASIIDLDNELTNYTYEKDDCEESGYSVKKYASCNVEANTNENWTWWAQTDDYTSSGIAGNELQGDHFEDFYLMRFADVLLMLTELTGDAQYMNRVQVRAGVTPTAYSLQAVQNERRWEFAFEGIRFNDMRRWSGVDNHSESSYAAKALQAQEGKMVVCLGNKAEKRAMHQMHFEDLGSSWAKRYAQTKGFLPKPQSQISLMNGKMVQNDGWDQDDQETQYRVLY